MFKLYQLPVIASPSRMFSKRETLLHDLCTITIVLRMCFVISDCQGNFFSKMLGFTIVKDSVL